jgi:hypothetical protein
MEVSELTVKLVAATFPNITALAPVKPEPVRTTVVLPEVGPVFGVMAVTEGADELE